MIVLRKHQVRAKQDRMTANSHQLSSSFDQVFTVYFRHTIKFDVRVANLIL